MTSRSQVYVNELLAHNYDLEKRRFYPRMMRVNLAHTLMLDQCGIIPHSAAGQIAGALLKSLETVPDQPYDPRYEDLFFLTEAQIAAAIGDETMAYMHVAFSRNDLDAAMIRMVMRGEVLEYLDRVQQLRRAVHDLASAHTETIMAAYTHNQQAQPITLAHYLLAVEANLRRDTERLLGAYARVNRSPMGAAALGTTGFPIDRQAVARFLGFDELVENSYDAICAADHTVEAVTAVMISATHLSRFVYDLMAMLTNEVNTLSLDDSLVQISSIMPQKRNPVALEHVRALLSSVIGRAGSVVPLTHNVPLGDINDVAEDLQPQVEEVFQTAMRAMNLLVEVLRHATVDTGLLEQRARQGFSAVTELADTLARDAGVPFRKAHGVVTRFVGLLRRDGRNLSQALLADVDAAAMAELGRPSGLSEEAFRQAIDPQVFVQRRSVTGGPAPVEVRRCLESAGAAIAAAEQAVAERRAALSAADDRLLQAGRTLSQA